MLKIRDIWRSAEHYFSPIDFAMVMATGILSIAALLEGYIWLATGLYYVNILLFIILFSFMLPRVIFEWKTFQKDLKSYQ